MDQILLRCQSLAQTACLCAWRTCNDHPRHIWPLEHVDEVTEWVIGSLNDQVLQQLLEKMINFVLFDIRCRTLHHAVTLLPSLLEVR